MQPYYADEHVQLYLGDMREVLPALGIEADACITDPPYGETSLAWDRWPERLAGAGRPAHQQHMVLRVDADVPRPTRRLHWLEAGAGRGLGEAQRHGLRR